MNIKLKKTGGILLALVMAISLFPSSVSAEWYSANKTDYDKLELYSTVTNTQKLTANGFSTYDFGYGCTFTNAASGELAIKNTSVGYQTFLVDTNTAFINNGTVSIDGLYNFGCQGTFTNNGTLYLNNVSNFSLDGFSNNGTVYYDDTINVNALDKIKSKTSAVGKVLSASGIETYNVSYNLNAIENKVDVSYNVVNDGNPTQYTYSYNTGSKTITLKSPTRPGYTFIGWTGDKISVPAVNASFETSLRKDLTFTANWTLNNYSISYDLNGGSFVSPSSVKNSYTYEDVTTGLPYVYRQGYIFQGWTGSNGTTPETPAYIPAHSIGNKSYTANWIAANDIAYTIVRYYQRTDGSYSSEETAFAGITGSTVSADPDNYARTGFTFNPTLSTVSGEITADGSLKLKLYYDINKYTVEFRSYDGSSLLDQAEFAYGERVRYNGTVPSMDDEDNTYSFTGWALSPNQEAALRELPSATKDIILYAAFSKAEKRATIVWEEHTGFKLPANATNKVEFNSEYKISLELENEYYCVGTKEWVFPSLKTYHIYGTDKYGKTLSLKLGKDFTITQNGFGEPVVLTIPKVEYSLNINLEANYHDEHDYRNTEIGEGKVKHFCYFCGKTLEHTLKDEYFYDENGHWHECSECSETSKINYTKHSYDSGKITKMPTETSEGIKTYTCTVCGYEKTEAVPKSGHTPAAEWEYDAENHWKPCTECGEKLETAAHSYDNGVITTAPTETSEGIKTYTCTVCGYEKTESIEKLPSKPAAVIYPIWVSGDVTVGKPSAAVGETVTVSAPFGYDIIIADANGKTIAKISEKGSFEMPASGVRITAVRGEIFAHMSNAWSHSYVYSYDSDMERIKVNSDTKRGIVTIDLGADYAGRSFTLYSGRKSTSKKIISGTLDENGRYIFNAAEGRNYTLVIE